MDLYDEIAKVAHELYERDEWLHGRDLEHWFEAEMIVMARYEKQKAMDTAKNKGVKKTKVVKKTAVKKKTQKAKG